MFELKQSQALDVLVFAHDVNGDAVTGLVDAGFTKNISKNGAAFAAMTVTITERAGGWYLLPLSAVHTDTLGVLTIYLTHASAKQMNLQFRVAARITDDLATSAALATVQADTDDIQTRLPAALVAGRIDASVGAMAADVVTAAAIANGAIDAATFAAGAIDAAAIAADAIGSSELAASAVDEIVNAVWDETTAEVRVAATYGQLLKDNVNATVSSRAVPGDLMGIVASGITAAKFAAGAIDAAAIGTGAIDADALAADTITAAKIAPDAIGASELAADAATEIAAAVWDKATASHVASGSFGQRLAAVRAATAQAGAAGSITLDAAASATDSFYNNNLIVITAGTGVGQARFIEAYTGATKVGTVSPNWVTIPDATSVFVIVPFDTLPGASAPTAADNANAVWDELTSEARTAGSYGQLLKDDINATIASRATQTSVDTVATYVDTEVAAIKAKTDQLTFTNLNKVDAAVLAAGDLAQAAADKVWSSTTRTLTALGASLVQEIWDRATSALTTVGSAGKLLVDNLNATVSSRAASTEIGAGADAATADGAAGSLHSKLRRIDVATSTRAAPGDAMGLSANALTDTTITAAGANKVADHTLRRSLATAEASANGDALGFRSLVGAIAKLVNKVSIAGATLTVNRADDLTALGTQTVTTDAAANHITGVDTV